MSQATFRQAVRPSAPAWTALAVSMLLVLGACGGGGDAAPAPPAAPGLPGGAASVVASGPPREGPAAPESTASPTPLAPATVGDRATPSHPAKPTPPVRQHAAWSVLFTDPEGRAGPQGLNRLGQLAFTTTTAQGPRARFFDGKTVHEVRDTAATALAVNEAGRVAGHFEGTFTRAFRWDARTQQVPTALDHSPDVSSSAASINADGVAGGTQSSRRGFPGSAIRWATGAALAQGLASIGPLPLGSEGRFINASGAVAGVSTVSGGALHAAFWAAGSTAVQDLGTFGGAGSAPVGLNDTGQVAGQADTVDGVPHAFLWSDAGGLRDLGTLGGLASAASGLNASGWVVGTSDTPGGATEAFLWREGRMVALGTLGGRTSAASAINAAGLVGGNSDTARGVPHAFVWSLQSGMVDLNDRVAGKLPGVLQSVLAVADDGSVLALADGGLVLLRPIGAH